MLTSLREHNKQPSIPCFHRVRGTISFSGLVYISAQQFLSVMILLCWGSSKAAPLMYIVKFLEVASLNVWSLSSIAVTVLIASIVRVSHTLIFLAVPRNGTRAVGRRGAFIVGADRARRTATGDTAVREERSRPWLPTALQGMQSTFATSLCLR